MTGMLSSTSWVAAGVLLCWCGLGHGTTIRVPGDHPTIQAGIDAASEGDTVLVSPGTYTGDGNRDLAFGGTDIVLTSELGAQNTGIDCQASWVDPHRGFVFAPGEVSASVIDGFTIANAVADSGGGILCVGGSSPTFKRMIFYANRGRGGCLFLGNASAVVDSCTFIAGTYGVIPTTPGGAIMLVRSSLQLSHVRISDFCVQMADAAGIYCDHSTLTISDGLIEDCDAQYEAGGGGAYCRFSKVTMDGVTLDGNRAGTYARLEGQDETMYRQWGGGGMYCERCDLTVNEVVFSGNRGVGGGGGLSCGGSLDADHVTFIGNSAGSSGQGSGGGLLAGCSGIITHSLFEGNTAAASGGNLYCYGDSLRVEHSVLSGGCAFLWDGGNVHGRGSFFDVEITDGYADGNGGGMYGWGAVVLDHVVFLGNSAPNMGGGGLWLWVGESSTIVDCVFKDNRSCWGGGLLCSGSPEILRSVFVANASSGRGGGLLCSGWEPGAAVIEECTLVSNTGTGGGSAVACVDAASPAVRRCILAFNEAAEVVWRDASSDPLVEDCCIFGNAFGDTLSGIVGVGNFIADPLFCDFAGGDFHLALNSPCTPEHSPSGELVGALGVGCGPTGVVPKTWGAIKAMFR